MLAITGVEELKHENCSIHEGLAICMLCDVRRLTLRDRRFERAREFLPFGIRKSRKRLLIRVFLRIDSVWEVSCSCVMNERPRRFGEL